ncbi:hypothetical protein WA538_002695, partial [Blastocystis sp. DL]
MEAAEDIKIEAPATSSGRMLKTSAGRERSLSEERLKFIEEECDFLAVELAKWLSRLYGKEVDSDLLTSLSDGLILCEVFKKQIPSIELEEFHDKGKLSKFLGYDNISIFSRACQKMGIPAQECLSPIMFDNSQRKEVINSLLRFAVYGCKYGLKPLKVLTDSRLESFIKTVPKAVVTEMDEAVKREEEEEKKAEEKKAEEAKEEIKEEKKEDKSEEKPEEVPQAQTTPILDLKNQPALKHLATVTAPKREKTEEEKKAEEKAREERKKREEETKKRAAKEAALEAELMAYVSQQTQAMAQKKRERAALRRAEEEEEAKKAEERERRAEEERERKAREEELMWEKAVRMQEEEEKKKRAVLRQEEEEEEEESLRRKKRLVKSEQKEETHKKEERKRKSKKTPVEAKPLIQKETDSVVVKRQMKEEDKAKIVMWLVIAILILFILGSIYMH